MAFPSLRMRSVRDCECVWDVEGLEINLFNVASPSSNLAYVSPTHATGSRQWVIVRRITLCSRHEP